MVSLEKINKLASGQQIILHERVGKFLNNHLREMKELCLVDEAQLVDYVAKTAVLRGEFKTHSFVTKSESEGGRV